MKKSELMNWLQEEYQQWEAEYRQWQERYERDMAQARDTETLSTTALQGA